MKNFTNMINRVISMVFYKRKSEVVESTEYWKPPINDFTHLLSNPRHCIDFQTLLRKDHSEENITFWISASDFQKYPSEGKAADIKRLHIANKAALQVNISSVAQDKIMNTQFTSDCASMFDDAMKEVYELMHQKFRQYVCEGKLAVRRITI